MEEELSKQTTRLSLIDVSSEDGFLFIVSPASDSKNPQTSETCYETNCFGVAEAESAQRKENVKETLPVFLEPSEPTRTRNVGKCNLRKSLAWDSAFFTSEGVLDPDELALVNKPLKAAGQALPGIEEDARRSTESSSTLGSDSWALENLEVDLFEDIRASIQKSGSNVASSISKAAQRELHTQNISLSQKVELASRNQMKQVSKLPSTSKRQSISKMEPEKKGEALACSRTVVTRKADQNSSLRPPKILSGTKPSSTVPTKKIVGASDCVKLKNNTSKLCGNVVNQRPAVSKKHSSGDSRSVAPRTLSSPKSSLGSTSTIKMRPAISDSLCNGSHSTSSGSTGNSATNNLRNKTLSRNTDRSSMDSTSKTPLRNPRDKIESRSYHLSAYVMSNSKFSSSISPASSLDGMSSESSSSICSASQRPNSAKASLDVISLDSLESEAPQSPDSQKHVHDQHHIGDEDSGKWLPNQGVEKASMEAGPLSNSTTAAAPKSSFVGNAGLCVRPSGLRMPSPKIGFFDAEKSAGITSNVCLQSHSGMQIGLLKNTSASGNLDGALKQKSYKFQSTRSLTQTGLMKFNSNNSGLPRCAAASGLKPTSTPHLQLSTPSAELSITLAMAEGDSNMLVKERLEESSLGQNKSNEKKILVSEGPVNGLSRNVKDVNLNVDTAKYLKGLKGFSHSNVGRSADTSSNLLYSSLSGELVQDRTVDFLHMTKPSVSTSPTKEELKLNERSPLAVNCSFGNTSISPEPMREPNAEKATNKTLLSPFVDKSMNTFTPNALSDHAVELGQENVIANSLKENYSE